MSVAILTLFLTLTTATAEVEPIFVPHTLLSEQELAEKETQLVREKGYTEEMASELVKRIPEFHLRFTETDIRRAFPTLDREDTRKSICGNSMFGGQRELVYTSPQPSNVVEVKRARCLPADGGVFCSPLAIQTLHYFDSPMYFYSLSDDVTVTEANRVLTLYRDGGIRDLPEWYDRANFTYREVTHIDRVGYWYVLSVGEYFCRGCVAKFKVVVESTEDGEPYLMSDADPEGGCI